MKKNFKFFAFSVLALFLGLASCKKDKDVVLPEESKGEATYVSFKISQSALGTYAAPANAHQATAEEKHIANANVYIFKNDGTYARTEAVNIGASNETNTIQLMTGENYYIYVAANLPTGFNPSIANRVAFVKSVVDVADVKDITTATTATPTPGTGFLMTNIDVAPQSIPAAPSATNPAVVSLNIGRAVSKTNVEYNEATAVQAPEGVFEDVEYQVINNSVKMHFMPNFVGTQVQGYLWDLMATPTPTGLVLPTGLDTDPNYVRTALLKVTPDNTPANVEQNGNGYSYAVVNTQNNPLRAATAAVMLKGKFVPSQVYVLDNTATPVTATLMTTTPYAKGTTFSYVEYSDGTNSKFYNGTLAATDVDHVKTVEGKLATVTGTVVEHTDGNSFYTIWLGEKNLSTATEKYSTLRNKLYWVEVTQILNVGNNTNVIPNPDSEIEGITNCKFIIHVLDWTVVNQTEQAGSI